MQKYFSILPEDIKEIIVSYLSWRDIYRLMRTSKSIKKFTDAYLNKFIEKNKVAITKANDHISSDDIALLACSQLH